MMNAHPETQAIRMTVAEAGTTTPARLDPRALWAGLWIKRFAVIIPTLAAAFMSYTAVNMIPARYEAAARVLVENRESIYAQPMIGERQMPVDMSPLDAAAISSHVQLMYSRDLAKDVIRDLKINTLPEFTAGGTNSFLKTPLLLLGLLKDKSRMTVEERVLDSYYDRLSISPVDKSRVIEVQFQSEDPLLASKVANAVADRYLAIELQAKLERDRRASQHVQNKIDELRKQVEEAEEKVQSFRARNEIFNSGNNQSLNAQQLSELSTQMLLEQTRFAESQARAKAIRDQLKSGKSIDLTDVLSSALIQNLIQQRTKLRGDIALAATELLPAHPRMRELQAQHADIERQIRDEAAKLARGLETDTKLAEVRLNSVKQGLEEMKKATTSDGKQDVALRALEREAKAQRDLLDTWLGMYRGAIARDSIEANNVDGRIVSLAAPSNSPAFPQKGPIVLIATLGTLLVASILVFANVMSSSKIFILHEAQAAGLPVAAREPEQVIRHRERVSSIPATAGFTLDPRNEKTVLADLLFTLLDPGNEGEEAQIIYIAGATSAVQEGQFALRLGRALVQAQRRAVIVDVNSPRPQLSLIANGYSGKGLSDLLAGKTPFASVIYRDGASRLNIIPFGSAQRDMPARAFTRPSFGKCLKALGATYDFVLLSGPAFAETEEAADIASLADRVVLIGYDSMPEDLVIKARDAFLATGASAVDVAMLVNSENQYQHRGRAAMVG
jgi:succinoglycan biosynthesis transport protein ExoP